MAVRDFERLLTLDYRLTTAEILYHLPDHPSILQTFLWQQLDRAPDFPSLHKFLNFWQRSLDGRLHSVRIAACELIRPSDYSACKGIFEIH